MSIKIENKTERLVILPLNSGQRLFIDPGTFTGELGDEEASENPMVKKLRDRGVIAVHTQPAVKKTAPEGPLKQSPGPAPVVGLETPGQKEKDKEQKKSKPKGGK